MNKSAKIILVLAAFAQAFCVTSCAKESVSAEKGLPIVIVHDNDVHCQENGYVHFAGWRDAIVAADTAYVFTVSSGDFVQGGLVGGWSRGEYIIDIMKEVGYDAVTLGNHEFGFGLDRMDELMGMLGKEKIVCANYIRTDTKKSVYLPYVIKQAGKKKIAFVGATTPYVVSDSYAVFNDSELGRLPYDVPEDEAATLVQSAVDEARSNGADYVVVLAHFGDAACIGTKWTSLELINQTEGIDAVLDGHSHSLMPERFVQNRAGKNVLLTQTGTQFSHYGKVTVSPSGVFHSECIPDSLMSQYSNAAVGQVVESIHRQLEDIKSQVVGHSDFDLTIYDEHGNRKVRNGETNFGDLTCDAFRYIGNSQVAIINGGSLRNIIKAGTVSVADILSAIPFLNYAVDFEVSGKTLMKALESSYALYPYESGGFLQVAGLKFTYDKDASPHFSDVMVLSSDSIWVGLDENTIYKVTSTDYVLGDMVSYPAFEGVIPSRDKYMPAYEVVASYLRHLGGEVPQRYRTAQGRIQFK